MEPLGIVIIIIIILIGLYLAFGVLVVFKANTELFGKRGEDPSNPCYLRFEDYPFLKRTPYRTGYYGKAIKGYLYQDQRLRDYKGYIILSHGFFGTHVQYLFDIALLTQEGYLVLAYDQFGAGLSEGKNQESLATGVYVMENVISDVEKNNLNRGLPIYLYGHSWGGYSVAGALKNHPEIKGAICRSAPYSPIKAGYDLLKKVKPGLAYFLAPVFSFSCWLVMGKRYLIKGTRGLKKNKDTPVLFIQAKNDDIVLYKDSLAKYYQKHPQKNAKVFLTDKGMHNSLLVENGQLKYKELVKKFHEIDRKPDTTKKDQEMNDFLNHLDRVQTYQYDEETKNEILSFLDNPKI